MCFDDDARAPRLPGIRRPAQTMPMRLRSADGHVLDGVGAVPDADDGAAAVLVVHDGRGLHPYYAALAEDLAAVGHPVLAIDLYGRTAGPLPRGDGFVSGEHSAQLRWRTVRHDLRAGVEHLRAGDPDRPVAVVGFCLGGRIALLAATCPELRLSGVVAFYAQTVGAARSDLPEPVALADDMQCPGLSIFGGADAQIPAADVDTWRAATARMPYPHEVVVYPGLGHSFFDRTNTESVAGLASGCADAAARTAEFLSAHGTRRG